MLAAGWTACVQTMAGVVGIVTNKTVWLARPLSVIVTTCNACACAWQHKHALTSAAAAILRSTSCAASVGYSSIDFLANCVGRHTHNRMDVFRWERNGWRCTNQDCVLLHHCHTRSFLSFSAFPPVALSCVYTHAKNAHVCTEGEKAFARTRGG